MEDKALAVAKRCQNGLMPGYRVGKIQTIRETRNPKADKQRAKGKETAEKLGMSYTDFVEMRNQRAIKAMRGEISVDELERLNRNEEFGIGQQK
jgi:PP-loop superfamily ATP-utilizing enzyme